MPLRMIALLVTTLLATNVMAVGQQYINPPDGKCSARMPNGDIHWSDSGNKIKFTLREEAGWLMAQCLITDIITGPDLPDSAVPYSADDFGGSVPPCYFKDLVNGQEHYTDNYHVTVTPAGNIKLVCFFEFPSF